MRGEFPRPGCRELYRHAERIRQESPLDIPPRHALRPWCVVALWLVAAFLLLASFTTFRGW
jgi:hypothetical protein